MHSQMHLLMEFSQECKDTLFKEYQTGDDSTKWQSNKLIQLGLVQGPKQPYRVQKAETKHGKSTYVPITGLRCMRFKNAELECTCFASACAELDETDFDWLPQSPARELSDDEPALVILSTENRFSALAFLETVVSISKHVF